MRPMERPLQVPLFGRAHLGQRVLVREQNVHHARVERLHHSERFSRHLLVVPPDADRLVPAHIGLHEAMHATIPQFFC